MIEFGSLLEEPQDVYSFLVVGNGATHDSFNGEGTHLDFNGYRNAIYLCENIRLTTPNGPF